MTDNTKHTETPWTAHMVNTATINIRAGEISVAAVYRHVGSPVLQDRAGEGDGNAAFIVRAVNSHAALVEALEYARNMARPDSGPESTQALPPSSYEWEQLRLKADEALKLAKGVA